MTIIFKGSFGRGLLRGVRRRGFSEKGFLGGLYVSQKTGQTSELFARKGCDGLLIEKDHVDRKAVSKIVHSRSRSSVDLATWPPMLRWRK